MATESKMDPGTLHEGISSGSGNDSPATTEAPIDFEAGLAELEAIVASMEGGTLTLEQSLAAYKRGAQLLQFSQAALKDAQQQVKILEADTLQDFSGSNGNGQ